MDTYFLRARFQTYEQPLQLDTQGKAVGPCPVKVIGIPEEKLKDIYKISPELEKQMRALAKPVGRPRAYVPKY